MNIVESPVFSELVSAVPYIIVRYFGLQLAPDHSNLQEKLNKVQVNEGKI